MKKQRVVITIIVFLVLVLLVIAINYYMTHRKVSGVLQPPVVDLVKTEEQAIGLVHYHMESVSLGVENMDLRAVYSEDLQAWIVTQKKNDLTLDSGGKWIIRKRDAQVLHFELY